MIGRWRENYQGKYQDALRGIDFIDRIGVGQSRRRIPQGGKKLAALGLEMIN